MAAPCPWTVCRRSANSAMQRTFASASYQWRMSRTNEWGLSGRMWQNAFHRGLWLKRLENVSEFEPGSAVPTFGDGTVPLVHLYELLNERQSEAGPSAV